jgi:hypothetical protein
MSHYIHHVPGRLRVRASTFRCSPARIQVAIRAIEALDGVTSVTFNARAGSITVRYDPRQRCHLDLLATLEEAGCLQGIRQPTTAGGTDVAELFGKAVFGALVQRTAQSLVAAIL